jgi:hypothetical protein
MEEKAKKKKESFFNKLEVLYKGEVYHINYFTSSLLELAKKQRPNENTYIFRGNDYLEVCFKDLHNINS